MRAVVIYGGKVLRRYAIEVSVPYHLAITTDRVRQKGQSYIPRLKDFGNKNFTAFTQPTSKLGV